MSPRVSVICAFLNGEAFLDETARSVLAQTFEQFEFLLCDDGSGDAASALAHDWAARDPRVRSLEHPGHANLGTAATRNMGLEHARGDFVAFIDADDVWLPEKLAEQMEIMQAHPELGMVCGTVRYWSSWMCGEDRLVPSGHALDRVISPPEATLKVYPLGAADAPCPSDLLMRREVVEAIGGFEPSFTGPLQLYEDQAFLSKLYLAWPVWFSSKVWLNYRQHEDSCVAEVTRAGRYDEVRHYFLTWFESYLTDRPELDSPAVRGALDGAFRRDRASFTDKVAGKLRRLFPVSR